MSHFSKRELSAKINQIHNEVAAKCEAKRAAKKEYLRQYLSGEVRARREWISTIVAHYTGTPK